MKRADRKKSDAQPELRLVPTSAEPADATSDESLMARYVKGDAAAFEVLVRRHADALLGFLVRMVRERTRAEDLFQETFLRVHTKADTFKPEQRFKAWLYAIAAHAAIDAMRKDARVPATFSFDAEDDDAQPLSATLHVELPHPSEKLSADERSARVRAAVETLPPRQRATVALAYFEGLTYPEVAAALGCTVGTVKTQVSRAMDALARILPQPDGGAR